MFCKDKIYSSQCKLPPNQILCSRTFFKTFLQQSGYINYPYKNVFENICYKNHYGEFLPVIPIQAKRKTFKNSNITSFLFPIVNASNQSNAIVDEDNYDFKMRIKELLDAESGAERIRRMFRLTIHSELSPELKYILHISYLIGAVGACVNSVSFVHQAQQNFQRQNTATPFESEYLARRRFTDTVTMAGLKGGAAGFVKYGAFSCFYLLFTGIIANYYNRISVYDHITAGFLYGCIYRLSYGFKGALAAGCLGGTLGLMCGTLIKTFMWLNGISFQELRYYNHEYYSLQVVSPQSQETKS